MPIKNDGILIWEIITYTDVSQLSGLGFLLRKTVLQIIKQLIIILSVWNIVCVSVKIVGLRKGFERK